MSKFNFGNVLGGAVFGSLNAFYNTMHPEMDMQKQIVMKS